MICLKEIRYTSLSRVSSLSLCRTVQLNSASIFVKNLRSLLTRVCHSTYSRLTADPHPYSATSFHCHFSLNYPSYTLSMLSPQHVLVFTCIIPHECHLHLLVLDMLPAQVSSSSLLNLTSLCIYSYQHKAYTPIDLPSIMGRLCKIFCVGIRSQKQIKSSLMSKLCPSHPPLVKSLLDSATGDSVISSVE